MGDMLTVRRDERGVAMITAMVVMLVVFATGALWVQQSVHSTQQSGLERSREQALAAAEAGSNRMMSQLSANATNCNFAFSGAPGPAMTGTISGGGEYEVELRNCNPASSTRQIVSRGYSPSKANAVSRRQISQDVDLVAIDGFRYGLFASNGGISGANQVTVRGDAYSYTDATISNNSTITGSLVSRGGVALSGSTKITGRVWANGAVNVNTSGTGSGVDGDVWTSVGGINVGSRIGGNAQAAGSITGTGTVGGSRIPNSPAALPPDLTLPTFMWANGNYPTGRCIWTNVLPHGCAASSTDSNPATAFKTYWTARVNSFSGHHRITTCGSPYSTYTPSLCSAVSEIALDSKWDMAGDTTIVSDGPLNISRDVNSGSGTLVIVSNYPGTPCTTPSTACNAIKLTNQWSIPSSVKVLIFAQNGCVDVSNLKTFTGTIYAKCIDLDNNFELTYYPVNPPGFDWSTFSSVRFGLQARTFREVPFGS